MVIKMRFNKTPNKGIKVNTHTERRLIGIMPAGRGVTAIYARTHDIDGLFFDVVEKEFVVDSDLTKLKAGNPNVIKEVFKFALKSVSINVEEIVRILQLRKS